MTLTPKDLQAIKVIVTDIVTDIVSEEIDAVKQQTAAAFSEVQLRLNSLEDAVGRLENTVGRIEMQQRAMTEQLDDHTIRIGRLEAPAAVLAKGRLACHNKRKQ